MGGCVPASPIPCELEDGVGVGRGVELWGQNQEGGTVGRGGAQRDVGTAAKGGQRGWADEVGDTGMDSVVT